MILALLKTFITFKPFNIGNLENFVFAREEEHIIFNVQLNLFLNFFENCARVFNYCKTETKSDQSIFQFLLIKKLCQSKVQSQSTGSITERGRLIVGLNKRSKMNEFKEFSSLEY